MLFSSLNNAIHLYRHVAGHLVIGMTYARLVIRSHVMYDSGKIMYDSGKVMCEVDVSCL